MITVRGCKVYFRGKDATVFKAAAKSLGLSPQNLLTGTLWEKIMQYARDGVFLKENKK